MENGPYNGDINHAVTHDKFTTVSHLCYIGWKMPNKPCSVTAQEMNGGALF